MIAFGKSDQECLQCHTDLVIHINDNKDVFLALDRFVRNEYDKKLINDILAQTWLKNLALNKKIRPYERCKLPKGLSVKLQDEHFDKDDYHCVRLVLATKSRRLVAEEKGYTRKVCRILKDEASVTVHSTMSICEHISANHSGEQTV
jgi:hypothetical protein